MQEASPFPTDLSPEMAALNARMVELHGPGVDTTLMPPAEGRARAIEDNRRWNVDLPPLAASFDVRIAADAGLGSAETRLAVLVPPGERRGLMLFVHGGGFAFCTPETHRRAAAVLATAAGMTVLMPDYRLAPEDPYPAGLRDVVASLRAVVADPAALGVEPGSVLIVGDSAGANLALAALLHEQAAEGAAVAGGLLFYGVYGADFDTPSYRVFHDGPGLTTPKMRRYWDWYLADAAARADPLAAPILASDAALAALPPLWLGAAGIDPLLSDTLGLVDRLRAIGRDDPFELEPGVQHGYVQMSVALAAANRTLQSAGRFARDLVRRD